MLRKALAVVAALALAGVAYRVLGVYELRSGECTAPAVRAFAATFPPRLRVMSWNIEGHAALLRGDHIESVAEVIRREHPDIVAVNEAHRGTWQARFEDHVEQLRRLTGMNVAFGRSYRFAGGDFGNAILTRGSVLSTDVHRLPGVGEPRTLLESVVGIDGGVVTVFVTHTSAWASMGQAVRARQLDCVAGHLRSSRHPFVLAGDLNAPPDSPEIASFLRSNPLRLAGRPLEPTHRLLEQRLDYVLAGPGWNVARAAVLDVGPSDHRPIVAELTH